MTSSWLSATTTTSRKAGRHCLGLQAVPRLRRAPPAGTTRPSLRPGQQLQHPALIQRRRSGDDRRIRLEIAAMRPYPANRKLSILRVMASASSLASLHRKNPIPNAESDIDAAEEQTDLPGDGFASSMLPLDLSPDRKLDIASNLIARSSATLSQMRFTRRVCRFLLVLILSMCGTGVSPVATKAAVPAKHATWLNEEVPYIITNAERSAFLALKTTPIGTPSSRPSGKFAFPIQTRRPTSPATKDRRRHTLMTSSVRPAVTMDGAPTAAWSHHARAPAATDAVSLQPVPDSAGDMVLPKPESQSRAPALFMRVSTSAR